MTILAVVYYLLGAVVGVIIFMGIGSLIIDQAREWREANRRVDADLAFLRGLPHTDKDAEL